MNTKELCNGIIGCECGKDHLCPIDFIEIGSDVLPKIYDMCEEYDNVLLVADSNTYKVCGENVEQILAEKITSKIVFDTPDFVLIPDEEAIEKIEGAILDKTDIIVGVGSGVINDLCKYVSHKHGLPYYIVATAPSMDGYASVGSALILKGMKVTLGANPPKGIIADTSSIFLKQWVALDTPSIKFISTSENPELYNTLASLHMYRYAKIYSADGDTVYPLSENDGNQCDDIYFVHLGSASDKTKQEFVFEPSNLFTDNLQCRPLDYKQQECN